MSLLNYLTIQDILWINLQVTKKVQHFSFAKLEEATFYQYAYGDSNSLIPQAARFLTGFSRLRPFEAGSRATAFVAVLSFLVLNGMKLKATDADAFERLKRMDAKGMSPHDMIAELAGQGDDHGHTPSVQSTVKDVLEQFECTIESLMNEESAMSA